MKNLITLTQFKTLRLPSTGNEIERVTELANTVSAVYPASVYVGLYEEDGKELYNSCCVRLQHPDLDIQVRRNGKQFYIYCRSIEELKNITHYVISQEKKNHKEPNNIGVLTANKVVTWINYYEGLYAALKLINEANAGEISEFLNSIEGFLSVGLMAVKAARYYRMEFCLNLRLMKLL